MNIRLLKYSLAATVTLSLCIASSLYIEKHIFSLSAGKSLIPNEKAPLEVKPITVTNEEKEQLATKGYTVENRVTYSKKIASGVGAVSLDSRITREWPNTIEQLANKSDIIFEGQVIGVRYFEYKSSVYTDRRLDIYTESKIKILKSYSEKAKPGDVVTFVEQGGITTKYKYLVTEDMLDKFPLSKKEIEKARNEYVLKSSLLGIPVMMPNDHVILFGVENKEGYGLPVKSYSIYNGFLGKFIITDKMVENFIPREYDNYGHIKMSLSEMELQLRQKIN